MKKKKLWQKNWQLNSSVEEFETKDDIVLDQQLVKYDVYGSLAHAAGLQKIGVLTPKEFSSLKKGLIKILKLDAEGKFQLETGDEDIHTKIENFLTAAGTIGKKIHTGRSRNDQVLTAIRLFTRENLLVVWESALGLATTLSKFAANHIGVQLPGYTHMQKAMPSSVGLWAGAMVAGLLDDISLLEATYNLNNQSPLGSAAGYGVPLQLDRNFTAGLLGFNKTQINPLSCQNSRGKIEATIVAAFIAVSMDINKLASDILLFTTSEFNFFTVDKELCSGSSLMPNKRNVDIAELLRSKVHVLLGHYTQLVSGSTNLISGYNRDMQDTKKPFWASIECTVDSIRMADLLVNHLHPNLVTIKTGMTKELFATQRALELVGQGVAFRDAYVQTAAELANNALAKPPTSKVLDTAVTGLNRFRRQLREEQTKFKQVNKKHQETINNLLT